MFDRWNAPFQPSDLPCNQAPQVGLQCLKLNGTWHDIERLDQPVVVELWDDQRANRTTRRCIGHRDDEINVKLGAAEIQTTADALTNHWYGTYIVLWQMPPDYRGNLKIGDEGPSVAWLRQHLAPHLQIDLRATDPARFDDGLRAALIRFQRENGMVPDGIAGPMTWIAMNAALADAYPTAERGHLTMSYILDALKKSEAERSRGSVPTLLIPAQTHFRSSVAIWVLLGALIVNACLFAAWMFWPLRPVAPQADAHRQRRRRQPPSRQRHDCRSRAHPSPPQTQPVQAVDNAAASQTSYRQSPTSTPVRPPRIDPRAPQLTSEDVPTPTFFVFDSRLRHRPFDARRHDERQTIRRRRHDQPRRDASRKSPKPGSCST